MNAMIQNEASDPIICFDFFYVDVGGEELSFFQDKPEQKDVMTILIVVDKSTGMCRAVPLPSKGDESLVHGAKEVLGFISYLGYQSVGIRGDNEPSAVALTKMICQARSKLGLKTVDKPCQPYEHATNGAAEQAVQGIRDLGTTLLEQLKAKSGADLKTSDELVGWAYVHASMLHNAFAVHAGTTPYEKAFNLAYNGKLVRFGETVLFALNQSHVRKGRPKFVKGIWLGKTLINDMNVVGTALGIYLSGTVRRLPPEQQWSKHMVKEFRGRPYAFTLSNFGKVVIPGIKERKKPEAIEMIPSAQADPVKEKKKPKGPPSDEAGSDPVSSPNHYQQVQVFYLNLFEQIQIRAQEGQALVQASVTVPLRKPKTLSLSMVMTKVQWRLNRVEVRNGWHLQHPLRCLHRRCMQVPGQRLSHQGSHQSG